MEQDRTTTDCFDRLAQSKFRSRFKLNEKDRAYVTEKCMDKVMHHARNLLSKRLFPAEIAKDGK